MGREWKPQWWSVEGRHWKAVRDGRKTKRVNETAVESSGRDWKRVEKKRVDQGEIVISSGEQQERQWERQWKRQWEASLGGHARAPDPSRRHPSSPIAHRSPSLAQPHARSWCRPPCCPHPAAVTDSQQAPRATTATTSSSRSRLAVSSAVGTRHRQVQRPARKEHPQASPRGPLPPPCAGASPRQRLLPDSHLGWALLSPAPAARSRRDCHRHRGRWIRGQRQTSDRHRSRSVPCPGWPRWPCGLCSASKEKCSWFLQKQKCAEVRRRGKYTHSTGVLPLAGHHHLVPLHTPKLLRVPWDGTGAVQLGAGAWGRAVGLSLQKIHQIP